MPSRFDTHPNICETSVTQSAADTDTAATIEEIPKPQTISRSKLIVPELLKVQFRHYIILANNAQSKCILESGDGDDIAIHEHLCKTTAAGTAFYNPTSPQYDLTDGQGNGILCAKQPVLRIQSYATSLSNVGRAIIFWRWKEVNTNEFIALQGGAT